MHTTAARGLAPFCLKDAPSFIEVQFPVGRLSAEAYKERKAGAGQTLTALGSYWKGRKPLILVRGVVLGALLPATDKPAEDLRIFLKLMGMDDEAFLVRMRMRVSEVINRAIDAGALMRDELHLYFRISERFLHALGRIVPLQEDWQAALAKDALFFETDEASEKRLRLAALSTLSYAEKVQRSRRPEECHENELLGKVWSDVNRHLGTAAHSLPELVDQLGIARFGHRPRLADTFCGGGSIPFEAARIGCDVHASDLNPIACMLTWGAFNIIGASPEKRAEIERAQQQVADAVEAEITRLGIEHDKDGNRAKAYLYCLETRCPKTGWMVPMAPSWVISRAHNVVAKLVPSHETQRYLIEIHSNVSTEEMAEAELGTVRDGRLVHPMNPERSGVEIKTIRGDYRDKLGITRNRLRSWEKSDFVPRLDDIFQERLYCILWIKADTIRKSRPETYFAAVIEDDIVREGIVESIVQDSLKQWQEAGLVPDMIIEPGEKTSEPIRTRGWTYWHHLFSARQLFIISLVRKAVGNKAEVMVSLPKFVDRMSKLCRFDPRNAVAKRDPTVQSTFYNQSLNPLLNYGVRSAEYSLPHIFEKFADVSMHGTLSVSSTPASANKLVNDIYIYQILHMQTL